MKITCAVVRDILPLYVENMASNDSRRLVEEHVKSCDECKKNLAGMETDDGPVPAAETVPLRKLRSLLLRHKINTIILSVFLAAVIAVIIGANLAAPEYFPYTEELVSLREGADGVVYASFGDQVTGIGVSSYPSDDGVGLAYHLVAWDSIWDRELIKKDIRNTVLNPKGEKVSAVYYYETNGDGEILIYGEPQNPSGMVIKQPKLEFLAVCAAMLLLVSCVLLAILRRNKKAADLILLCLLLPVSYLLCHFLVMGFLADTYSAAKNFWEILFVMIPCYGILFLGIYLAKWCMRKRYS